ncbi:hypothetical protein FSP39_018273 [Pinctada imbricata]|uniref:Uncharacterized protein n=1 Tax=Pinctada imbricata TaxID=66713 RepID=A0AA88YP03_PINIB|nr:hypothetical protein FSP39_018273 [Pinctada imbricata]
MTPYGCSCAVRCCPDAFSPRRITNIFHMPNIYSIGCCGCIFCPSVLNANQMGPPIFLTMVMPVAPRQMEMPEPPEMPEPAELPEPPEMPEPAEGPEFPEPAEPAEFPEIAEPVQIEQPEIELKSQGPPEIEQSELSAPEGREIELKGVGTQEIEIGGMKIEGT